MQKCVKSFSFLLCGMLCVFTPYVSQASENVKIGFVDLHRALNEVDEGIQAKTELKKIFDKKQVELTAKQQDLQNLKEMLDKQGLAQSENVKKEKMAELQNKFLMLQQQFMQEQKDLSEMEEKMTKDIFDKMRNILADIGKAEQFTLILEVSENRLLYAKPHLDLTNQLIRLYNEKSSAPKKKS